jgi:hypothetical protein
MLLFKNMLLYEEINTFIQSSNKTFLKFLFGLVE